MISDSEHISFVLKHSDISTNTAAVTASNDTGSSWSAGKQTTTWRVNMATLCGDMWRKYNTFVLRLNQVSFGTQGSNWATTNNDLLMIVKMSGLTFINSTYDVKTGNQTGQYQMCLLNVANNAAGTVNFGSNVSVCNFKKGQDWVDIRLECIRCSDGKVVSYTTNVMPHMVYSFDIYPIE